MSKTSWQALGLTFANGLKQQGHIARAFAAGALGRVSTPRAVPVSVIYVPGLVLGDLPETLLGQESWPDVLGCL